MKKEKTNGKNVGKEINVNDEKKKILSEYASRRQNWDIWIKHSLESNGKCH